MKPPVFPVLKLYGNALSLLGDYRLKRACPDIELLENRLNLSMNISGMFFRRHSPGFFI